jgi:MFS family permease
MVAITFGEMIVIPTAQALVARLAPEDKRGRYMAVFGLSWGISATFGPYGAGLILDNYNPNWVWYLGGILAAVAWRWPAFWRWTHGRGPVWRLSRRPNRRLRLHPEGGNWPGVSGQPSGHRPLPYVVATNSNSNVISSATLATFLTVGIVKP